MGASAIGVDLGGTKVALGRVDAAGAVTDRVEEPTDHADPLGQITRLATSLADAETIGIGVGVPGTVDHTRGFLIQAVNLDLANVAVGDDLAAATRLVVRVDNDANCAALAEHRFGAARDVSHSVMLTLGTGVGGGIVASDELLRGVDGGAGELGHIVVSRDGRPCQGACRGRGHLEAYCSGNAVGARGRELGLADDAHGVISRAQQGDAGALDLLTDTAGWLAAGVVTIAHSCNPQLVVIGGGFGQAAADFLIERCQAIVRAEALSPNNQVRIVRAKLGADAGLIGAAALLT